MSARTPRMPNVVTIVPEMLAPLQAFSKAAEGHGVPAGTIALAQLRASQINGCSVCVDMHAKFMAQSGATPDRLAAVAVWRDSPQFTDAERAALDLAESVTRIADRPDAVSDAIWEEARRHYDEPALAGLLIGITAINAWNRLNVATRQVPGSRTRGTDESASWEPPRATAAP